MNKTITRIAGIGAALVVAATGAAVNAPAASADGLGHNAVIKYRSGPLSKIQVCHNAASTTSCKSGIAWLPKGKNTKSYLGWADADMVWIDSGRKMGGIKGPRWLKVAGCGGCTYNVDQV